MEFAELITTPKLDQVIVRGQLNNNADNSYRLCITGHHLILSANSEESSELWLLHQNFDYIERKPYFVNQQLDGGSITLKCKDLRVITLDIANKAQEYLNIANSLEKLSALAETHNLYPFFYRPMFTFLEDGYTMFSPEIEYSKLLASDEWRLSNVNKDYNVCSSYSAVLVVPKQATDEQIIQSAGFRTLGRFPIISFRHENGAILLRSSQPANAAQGSKRCRADEAILNMVLGKSSKGFIIDPWGKNDAKRNSETDQHYTQWKKVTRPIGNFSHTTAILDAFSKLMEAINDITCSSDKWLSRLENSGWLSLVLNSLNVACTVAQCLHQDAAPVLVHGGKGMDVTLITTSLVQIILNPDCRTIRGLQALVEREWLQAGHPFASRHKQSCYTPSQNRGKTSGATFVLFLDCVYQIYNQFPCSFEYDSNLLVILFEHSYFSQYGSFLCDSERERKANKLSSRTTSLWSHLNRPEVLKSLLNPIYEPNPSVIWPSVAPVSIVLWMDLYARFVIDQSRTKRTFQHIQHMVNGQKELRSQVIRLRKQLLDLHKEYQEMQKGSLKNDNHSFSSSLMNDSSTEN